jgi:glutamine---fructose-6-phosphate transaminase (isomerizing)
MRRTSKYNKFSLAREMLETPKVIKNFRTESLYELLKSIKRTKKLFLTGEGSSRIFPAKNTIYNALKNNSPITIYTEGARQAAEGALKNFTLLGASNSGKTKEVISLFRSKKAYSKFIITGNSDTVLKRHTNSAYLLNCGQEKAVSATKSVVEEALFYRSLLLKIDGTNISKNALNELSKKAHQVLTMEIDKRTIKKLAKAKLLYFMGRNDGVAEEAALKTNEITRKKSCYLEGTYAVHGVEESMDKDEAAIAIEPFKEEEQKFKEVLVDGVGMEVFAVSPRKTLFSTIRIPKMRGFDGYLQLLACWNLLVEIGLQLKINLDTPKRARKIGNLDNFNNRR